MQPTAQWDRHAIVAEIKRRYGTLTKLAARIGTTRAEISAALCDPYPKVDALIAAALGVPVHVLWPDRYHPSGSRRTSRCKSNATRPRSASQKSSRPVDMDTAA